MTHKSHLGILLGSISAVALCLGVAVISNNASPIDYAKADPTNYTVNLNSTVFEMSTLTTSYQTEVTQNLGQDKPIFNYFLAKKDNSNNLVLAPSGKLYNYGSGATYKGRITNIEKMTITYSGGALYVQEGLGGGATQYDTKAAVSSGVEYVFKTSPNHIMISNSRAETTITNIAITYSCEEAGFIVDRLGEKYNGKSAEGDTYVLTRDRNNVSLAGQNGTIALDGNGNFTITLAGGAIVYSGTVSSDYKTLTFTGKSGAEADAAPTIAEMNRIYLVNDFESYTDRGTGFTADQTSIFTASDLRGAHYVDAGSGSGNTWVSNSGFKIPSTANYLNLCTTLAHSGSKSMLLQGQKAGWVRLWSSEVFNQNQHYNFGSGNKLSFWIHSGRNNADGTGVNSSNVKIRAQVYYQNFVLTDSTRNSTTYGTGVKATVGCNGDGDLTIATGSGWNEVIINLDPTKTVYAINIMINNSGISTDYVFMPIDDITVYTEPVYEATKTYNETSTMITKSYHGSVSLVGGLNYTVKIGLGANGYVYAYAGANMVPTSYTINGTQIVIVTTGSIDLSDYGAGTKTFGTWTGTLSNSNSTITFQKANITGSITGVITSSSITLNEDSVLADGSEGTATLQSIFKRQYGSWTDDPGNADRITQNTDYYIQGNSAIRVRPYKDGGMRIIIEPSVAEAQGANIQSIAFWVYAPSGSSYHIDVYGYDSYTPVSDPNHYRMPGSFNSDGTTGQDGWHYVNTGLPSGFRKNFAIRVNSTSAQTILDYITYF